MAWSAARTWVTGELVTSAIMNQHVRDNLLAINSIPKAKVFHNAGQASVHATLTVLAFNSEQFDTDTIHDTVTNNSRLTCKTAGVYLIGAQIDWQAYGFGNYRTIAIRLNGATQIANDSRPVNAAGLRQSCETLYPLTVNDYVEALVDQDSGSTPTVAYAINISPFFWMVRVSE